VFAVTAQLLPVGASIGGHHRLAVQPRDSGLRITKAAAGPDARTDLDLAVRDELVPETFDAGSPSPLLVPVDQFVVSLASMASSGAFQGSASLPDIHPDLLTDAFGLRVGPEPSASRIIVSTPEHKSLTLESLFLVNNWPGLVALDSEIQSIRENQKSLTFKDAGKPLLIARVRFENKAGDGDGHVRLTPGAIRLVVDGKVYHPIGFMTSSGTLALVRADDLMAIPLKGDITAGDFVFAADSTVVNALGKKGSAGTPPFLEFKMLGRIPLSGVPVADKWVAGIDSKVLVKAYSPAAAGKPATPAGAPAAPGTPEPAPAPAPAP
jgi:hypothetical protein